MDFHQNKNSINIELEKFISILNELVPRYAVLVQKREISQIERKELGDMEHLLIELNSKITGLKNLLDEHLYGHSFDLYYKYKRLANSGDALAEEKRKHLLDFFNESLKGEELFNWN